MTSLLSSINIQAEARILLSLLPIPSSAGKIAQDWKAGVELLISNSVSGQTYPNINVSLHHFNYNENSVKLIDC